MNTYKSDPKFDAWVASLPSKHWAKRDLSAARLGWDAAINCNESSDKVIHAAENMAAVDLKAANNYGRALQQALREALSIKA